MENKKKLYSGNLGIEYGQYYIDIVTDEIEDDPLLPEKAFDGQENGLCGASQENKLFFVTGIQNGFISIIVELYSSEPEVEDSFGEIVEVSFKVGAEQPYLCEWAHEETYKLELEAGEYRVRYSIEGMEKDYDPENEDDEYWEAPVPGQKHLIQIWPANFGKDKMVKQTTENARYWHSEWGNK